ncbi:Ig-like domain-containing protein [Tenacibaculum maritimum]|uniref:Ig-like domain-containing protein n=1 Tax=Tenacibaculum maritimum TaxID=107401 RepID=UPI0012E52A68|nr:Ig-like domain-containing protein [Tenacibaculum maritimum]CAA0251298.1 conserved hypothetical protein [Tenacibaculum maritimum]
MKRLFLFLSFFIVIYFLTNCARKGRPEGGPKDQKAPIMVTANPPYKTVNFDKKTIKIYFDEYIVLKDLQKQLVISPPMKNAPIITPQGTPSKYISIKILDTLAPNTTYTFNFGNAVQDNNENNKLESFKYIFSTGKHIDSLYLKGSVMDAFKEKAPKNTSVLLYKIDSLYNDSIIYKEKPNYVTNTLDTTNFNLTNLKKGKYLLVALKEISENYLFNSKEDKIAFYKDTIQLPKDSVIKNLLKLFKEVQPFHFKRGKEVSKGHIIFGFTGKREHLKVNLTTTTPASFKNFSQFEKGKDTLHYWYTPFQADSLHFNVSNGNSIDETTVMLRKKKIDSLLVSSTVNTNLKLNDTLFLTTNNPITKIDTTKFHLVQKDSIKINYKLYKKEFNKLAVLFDETPKTNYRLTLFPMAITDLYQTSNKDTLVYNFRTKTIEDYGSITLDIRNNTNKTVLIQLLGKGNAIVNSKSINASQKIDFKLLEPAEYTIRAIIDTNKNNVWDTGNFLLRKQPEKVIYFPTALKLRANWNINEVFIVE